jgi:uncharacterized repeat protein (TIGR01451 family)
VTAAGQVVTYTFTVTNTGNVTLTGVGVTDNPVSPAGAVTANCQSRSNPTGTCSGTTTTLVPGQIAHFTGTYTVTQADVDHDSVADTATASGTPPSGGTVSDDSNPVSVDVTQSPSLSIAKSANPTTVTAAGQVVTYTFTVTNTGNVTLTGVGVTDNPVSPAGGVTATCQSLSSPTGTCSGTTTTLVPGQIAHFTGTYTVTQADVDHDSVADTATASGTPPSGGTVSDDSNPVSVDVTQSPSLSIAKSANPSTVTAAGQSVTYTFTVTNTGNVTLTGVGVTDVPTPPAHGLTATCQSLSNPAGSCSGATTTLAVGQIATFTGTYTVAQADMDHGSIVDSAVATGTSPSNTPVTANSSPVTVDATQSPSLSIVKSASPKTVTRAGQLVFYTFTVTNTGNVTLSGVGVIDNPVSPAGGVTATCRAQFNPPRPCSGATARLVPGQRAIFTGIYRVTQADMDHGSIVDTSTTQGTTPTGGTVSDTSSTVTVGVAQFGALFISKSANPTTVSAAGQTIDYTFIVTNTGNVTLTGVGVTDNPVSPAGGVTANCQSLSNPGGACSGATTTLAVGQSAVFSGTYTVTQNDIDHLSVADTATAAGTTPSGASVNRDSNPVSVDVIQGPALSIEKSADPTTVTAAGQTVDYTFTVTNTGNETLTGVGVTDAPTPPAGGVTATCQSLSNPAGTCAGATTTLAVGQSAVFTGTYTVTQADADNGSIADTATTQGTTPAGGTVDATSNPASVVVIQSGSLTLAKSADPSTVTAAGQTIDYTFTVINSGNVTLTGVGVTDVPTAPAGVVTATCQSLSNPAGTCSGATTTLVPGQTAVFSGTYTVTQDDIDDGSIVDTATATGTPPAGPDVTAGADLVIVDAPNAASLAIDKSADPTSVSAAGQTITYTFTVTNTGNVTLTGVGVTDNPVSPAGGVTATCQSLSNPAGTCAGATTTLAVGQSAVFTGTYTVTQDDLDHGSIGDTATATGTTPTGGTVDGDSNPVSVDANQTPALSIAKSATPMTVAMVGQTIDYTFTVTNTGNVTLTDVGVTDNPAAPAGAVTATCQSLSNPAGACSGAAITLVPGQTATFTGTYTVTLTDLTHGSIADTATATGAPPSGGTTSATSSSVTVAVTHVTVAKSASTSSHVVAGSSTAIHYTITVANSGTAATSDPVVVTDAAPAGTTLVPGSAACAGGPPPCTVAVNGSSITWTIPPGVAGGISYTLTFSVTTNPSNAGATITNTATWNGPTCGPTSATSCPTDTVSVPVSPTPSPTPKPGTPKPPTSPHSTPPDKAVVAFTGALLSREWFIAAIAGAVGVGLLVAARWRRRRPRRTGTAG